MSSYCSLRIRLAATLFKVINISSLDHTIKTDLFEHRDPVSARKKDETGFGHDSRKDDPCFGTVNIVTALTPYTT